jgi:hypothetical protein
MSSRGFLPLHIRSVEAEDKLQCTALEGSSRAEELLVIFEDSQLSAKKNSLELPYRVK